MPRECSADLQRRSLLLVALAAAAGGAASCGSASTGATPRAVEVAAGVFMVPGTGGEVDAANLGRIGNAGFVVGERGVVAIDTGTSYRHGVALLDEIARVADRPPRAVFITHARQEFLFGAAAFRERSIPIHMHRKTARLMLARCEGCLKTLRATLGDDEMQRTEVVRPYVEFDDPHVVETIGRPLRVLHYGLSSGPSDIALLDERTGTLFAGGLLDQRRVPDVQDGDIAGWKQALQALRELGPRAIVPGHGAAAGARLIDTIEDYLTRLEARLVELLDKGVSLSEVAHAASLPAFEDWDQYGTIHRRNASIVFLRLEREMLLK